MSREIDKTHLVVVFGILFILAVILAPPEFRSITGANFDLAGSSYWKYTGSGDNINVQQKTINIGDFIEGHTTSDGEEIHASEDLKNMEVSMKEVRSTGYVVFDVNGKNVVCTGSGFATGSGTCDLIDDTIVRVQMSGKTSTKYNFKFSIMSQDRIVYECSPGELTYKDCWDGSTIRKQICDEDGEWRTFRPRDSCPDVPEPELIPEDPPPVSDDPEGEDEPAQPTFRDRCIEACGGNPISGGISSSGMYCEYEDGTVCSDGVNSTEIEYVCTNTCPADQLRAAYPVCTCYLPAECSIDEDCNGGQECISGNCVDIPIEEVIEETVDDIEEETGMSSLVLGVLIVAILTVAAFLYLIYKGGK